jgi:ADP-ribosylarginine hydrolase
MSNIEAGFVIASYLDTLGFKNGSWEFNYDKTLNNIDITVKIWLRMIHEFLLLGGNNINISKWNASDDTIMMIATAKALIDNDIDYKKAYLECFDELLKDKRSSGLTVKNSLYLLQKNQPIPNLSSMGGNGCAMRTMSIGIKWHDEKKIIQEALIASRLTHNYYIGYMGGVVSALFSSYAYNKIKPWLWVDKLLDLYNNNILHECFPKEHPIEQLDNFIDYWKRYNEERLTKIKYKSSVRIFNSTEEKLESLLKYNPSKKKSYSNLGITGIDSCIYAYDCLLSSMTTPNSDILDFNNIIYSWDSFMINVAIHPGDNDTTGCIGGFWYGLLLGYHGINTKTIKQLEYYNELVDIAKKFK